MRFRIRLSRNGRQPWQRSRDWKIAPTGSKRREVARDGGNGAHDGTGRDGGLLPRVADPCSPYLNYGSRVSLKVMRTQKSPVKKHSAITLLVIPLLSGAALAMCAALYSLEPWRSLLVNISAGLLGSLVTVFFVDQMLRRREQSEWAKVSGHVQSQVTRLAIATASSVRLALRIPPPVFADVDRLVDPKYIRQMMLIEIEGTITPQLGRLPKMTQKEWSIFAQNLAGSIRDAERLLTLFAKHLDSTVAASVLDIEEKARSVLGQYQTWPDMLGVPFEEMKPNNRGESMVPYFKAAYKLIIKDCDELLAICATLLRSIEDHFSG